MGVITDTIKAKLNKMNRAAQDAKLGNLAQTLESNLSYRIIDGSTGKKLAQLMVSL